MPPATATTGLHQLAWCRRCACRQGREEAAVLGSCKASTSVTRACLRAPQAQVHAHLSSGLQVHALAPLVARVCQAQVAGHQLVLPLPPGRPWRCAAIRLSLEAAVSQVQAGGLQACSRSGAAGRGVCRPAGGARQVARQVAGVQGGMQVRKAGGVGLQREWGGRREWGVRNCDWEPGMHPCACQQRRPGCPAPLPSAGCTCTSWSTGCLPARCLSRYASPRKALPQVRQRQRPPASSTLAASCWRYLQAGGVWAWPREAGVSRTARPSSRRGGQQAQEEERPCGGGGGGTCPGGG